MSCRSLPEAVRARRVLSWSHPTYLARKLNGDQSMSGKQEMTENVYVMVLQDPRTTVKARLLEAQSPAVELHTPRHHV
jgi:hypothetical protein